MRIATWNINSVKPRLEHLLTWLKEASPTSPACRRSSASTRRSRAEAFEALGYNVAVARPEGLQRRRDPLEAPARGRHAAACPATTPTSTRAIIEAVVSAPSGVVRVGLDLPAQRQSRSARRQVRLQARLDGPAASRHAARLLALRGAARARRRLQRHPRAARRQAPGRLDAATRCSSPRPRGQFRALLNLGLTDAVRACDDGPGRLHLLGLSGRRLAEATTASASTTCCSRRRPPTGWRRRGIDKHTRGWEKPSDHVPVVVELDLG